MKTLAKLEKEILGEFDKKFGFDPTYTEPQDFLKQALRRVAEEMGRACEVKEEHNFYLGDKITQQQLIENAQKSGKNQAIKEYRQKRDTFMRE